MLRHETIKLLEENMQGNLCDLKLAKDFLRQDIKGTIHKEQIDKIVLYQKVKILFFRHY